MRKKQAKARTPSARPRGRPKKAAKLGEVMLAVPLTARTKRQVVRAAMLSGARSVAEFQRDALALRLLCATQTAMRCGSLEPATAEAVLRVRDAVAALRVQLGRAELTLERFVDSLAGEE